MGLRFRKSFKIAPGVKVNLNKKSTSVTFGGKGAHYTINSKGKRTASVGIPGTGLYYTETSNSNSYNSGSTSTTQSSSKNTEGRKKRGCLFYIMALIIICVALAVYSFAWIPAIGCIIFFAVKKDANGNRKRNLGISIAVLITSFLVFIWLSSSNSLTGIQANWDKNTYDVSETTEVEIVATPDDAKIDSLELSNNTVAELTYTDGEAVITFKKAGKATLYFIANGDIDSNKTTITVTDKAAEKAAAEAKAKEEAEKAAAEAQAKAEAEAAAKAQAEAEAQAAAQAQAEAEAAAQAQAEAEAQAAAQAQAAQAQQNQQNVGGTVYWTPNGEVYHSTPNCPSLGRSKTILSGTIAQSGKSRPCKNCY